MNPIPLNDRGQYRYTDFVGYMPEYLKEEPDVVELLQVFSDYMNNAYRNIETVEKFDFKLCVPESTIGLARKRLAALRDMFEVASGRGDRVAILSVPRANVKSNAVYSRGNPPYVMDVDLAEPIDVIRGADSYDSNLLQMADGDVVFAEYINVEGKPRKAYYVAKRDRDVDLILDPMGGSQDPFTGTANSTDRMVTFSVGDVTSLYTRYGSTARGCKYYEVFFTATISNVLSEDALVHRDMGDARLAVDYYGLHAESGSSLGAQQYYTTIGFSGNDGWAWVGGRPSAIIYMIDTSSTNITTADYGSSDGMADPARVPSMNRYMMDFSRNGNQLIATASTVVPVYDNMQVYAIDRDEKVIGRYVAEPVEGSAKEIRLTPADSSSTVDDLLAVGRAVIASGPLYYSRMIGDVDGSPMLSMSVLDEGAGMRDIKRVYACQASADSNIDIGPAIVTSLPSNKILVSGVASAYFIENSAASLYSGNVAWEGMLTITAKKLVDNGVELTYEPVAGGVPLGTIECRLTVMRSGYVDIDDTGAADVSGLHVNVATGTFLRLDAEAGDRVYVRELYGDDQAPEFNADGIAPGRYLASAIDSGNPDNGIVYSVQRSIYDAGSRSVRLVVNMHRGDIYGCDYYLAMDSYGNRTMYANATGIRRYDETSGYMPGDLVSYNGQVFRCVVPTGDGGVTPGTGSEYVDVSSEYRFFPRKYATNDFMPFYGPVAALEYEEGIDYQGEPSDFTAPLYICKAEDIRLKYGWEHREYLNYPTTMNRTEKRRNGYAEFYSSACAYHDDCFISQHDVVSYTPGNHIRWQLGYEVLRRGAESSVRLPLPDQSNIIARRSDADWVVTVRSPAHGLHDGCQVSVRGFTTDNDAPDINIGYVAVEVVDGDVFEYSVPAREGEYRREVLVPVDESAEIVYVGDYRYYIAGMPIADQDPVTGVLTCSIPLNGDAVGLKNGDRVTLDYLFAHADSVDAVVTGDTVLDNPVLTVMVKGEDVPPDADIVPRPYSAVRATIAENDIVRLLDGTLCRVQAGGWMEISDGDVTLPITLYSKDNLFDVSSNNPGTAIGDKHNVLSLGMAAPGIENEAVIMVEDGFEHLNDFPDAAIGHTMVFIENAYPSEYNGWHVVTAVNGPRSFNIEMKLLNDRSTVAQGCNGEPITVREGRWYKYSITGMAWSKVSNRATYFGNNRVRNAGDGIIDTELAHGLSVGDHVVAGDPASFAEYDCNHDFDFAHGRVIDVLSPTRVAVYMYSGEVVPGNAICRGIVMEGDLNNIAKMSGEYTTPVFKAGSDRIDYTYRFMHNSIVVAKAQYMSSDRMCYIVNRDGYWRPMRPKRAMKITSIGVEQVRTQSYYDYFDPDEVSAYTYCTYSDADVANTEGEYMVAGMHKAANVNFYAPALAEMDSTRNMLTEYSSGEDYANVAPRKGMSKDFHGVPDMKYPLAERIERLCYLRDPNVIDYDMIGYLARFMGYDLTALSDDIAESPVYMSRREREEAVRAAVASLPHYYSLGGTDAGLGMLLDTFGVIARAVTLWTNTNSPYSEMLSADEVSERLENDITGGKGTWSPTPYIDIEILHDERYPQFDGNADDISRIREQIRTFKPINVVFRDVVEKYIGTISINPSMTMGPSTEYQSLGAVRVIVDAGGAEDDPVDIDYGLPVSGVSNCAF